MFVQVVVVVFGFGVPSDLEPIAVGGDGVDDQKWQEGLARWKVAETKPKVAEG